MDFRTDLALERCEMLGGTELDGIEKSERKYGVSTVSEIKITNKKGADAIGKPVGKYITVEVPSFSESAELLDGRLDALTDEIKKLVSDDGTVLVAGLGNKSMTADALGPDSAEMIFVTRHISSELAQSIGLTDLRSVASVAPGVLGKTGIEASEIIRGIADTVKPSCIIAVDALAANDISRIGTTVQLSDTGISPGSGVGNKRNEISKNTLGIPVVAIGVPTVINAYTIAKNIIDDVAPDTDISGAEKYREMIVASREADLITKRASNLIALAINCALQSSISSEDLLSLM